MNFLSTLGEFRLGNFKVEGLSIGYILATILFSWITLKLLRRAIYGLPRFDQGNKYTIYAILKYTVYLLVIATSLRLLGVDISVLVASSAALFVGIGLGLRDLFSDFLSGVILLTDGTVKVGNVIQFGEIRVEVIEISIRTSTLRTREGKEIIIPNSYLTKNEIVNWSNQRNLNRHYIKLVVSTQDVRRAQEIILSCVSSHPKVRHEPEPYVRIESFANWGIELKLLFWSDEVFSVGRMLGDIRLLILESLESKGIQLPYPRHVVTIENNGKIE